MEKVLNKVSTSCVELNNKTIKDIYNHINMLLNARYSTPIKVLQSRHRGYEKEDFAQEVAQIILKEFETKKFPTINHLKKFINLSMEFHYLKEKRKYFYTKQRGSMQEHSIDETLTDNLTLGDTLSSTRAIDIDRIDLDNILEQNLFIVYDWSTCNICKLDELKKFKSGYILSVNSFIKYQNDYGSLETCRHFKSKGFYMTKSIFDSISQSIINYLERHNFIEEQLTPSKIINSKPVDALRPLNAFSSNPIKSLMPLR